MAAGAMTDHDFESAVAGDYILLKKLLNRRHVVAHYAWHRRQNFFHRLHFARIKAGTLTGKAVDERGKLPVEKCAAPRSIRSAVSPPAGFRSEVRRFRVDAKGSGSKIQSAWNHLSSRPYL
jgi:hypothetical protein